MTEKKSDFPTAALGFFGGAIVIGLWLFGVSKYTDTKFAGHSEKPAAEAEHK
jgi:hypothetical protein